MGSPDGVGEEWERPQHEVTVQSFKMMKTEVTVSQYAECVDAGVCSEPVFDNERHNWGKSGRESHPINGVNWFQVREFAEWVGGRLPSEAEWEYAARSGGQDIIYPWGNEWVTCAVAVIGSDLIGIDCGNETTLEVCSKPLDKTAQGLCDMAGNAKEWLEDDWHNSNDSEPYEGAPVDGSAWVDNPRAGSRMVRGGSWHHHADDCRSVNRSWRPAGNATSHDGIRVAMDL